MSEDWDLSAVVRSCSSLAASTNEKTGGGDEDNDGGNLKPENPLSPMADFSFVDRQEEQHRHHSFSFATGDDRDRERHSSDMDSYDCNDLQDSCKPFLPRWWSSSSSSSSLVSVSNSVLRQEQGNELQDRKAHGGARVFPSSATTIPPSVFVFRGQREEQQHTQVPGRSRKRKNQQKRTICHVTQENLSSDMWAWRKYGQKPIKGSPYPRNYYRCSSSKGCLARKQVERSNSDPNIFIVTYAGEHTHPRPTHRNSLAGSTRNKPQPVTPTHKPDPGTPGQAGSNDAANSTGNLSPTTPLKENDDVQATHVDEDIISQEITMDDDDEIDDDDDNDDDDDDVENLLIPNLAARDREDLFSDMQGLSGAFPP